MGILLNSRLLVGCAGMVLLGVAGCKPAHKEGSRQKDRAKFGDNVRTTEFRTPEQERLGFTLPEGFEITLFASEPDIKKPMNMEFDDRGRLWVTQSSEYPLPAAPGRGTDRITILEDTNGDGKADVFTPFNEKLNIPIGILPVNDGAFAYSIPNVTHYKDSNGDDKSDQEQVVLGPFGHRDTHGMVSNLIRGFDGWIYACHGFTNASNVAGTDGDTIKMVSGNTFRFKPDGSRAEQTTFGRVNPFGNAFDEMGNLYSVDCHSKPIYQLITGAEYPHFGKKAPGIGFAPEMMSYELGSTAISGLVYYTGLQFPEEYRHSFFNGDVVTCQINRNTVTYKGSTPVSKREPDFLVSDDPWFRPVDMKVGPDGALYVADFYNRIIGHYEVALNHPGRDRVSGRIWKITYNGNKPHQNLSAKDWSKATLQELMAGLTHPQLNMRMKIADRLTDTWKEKAIEPVKQLMNAGEPDAKVFVQGLWILHRLNALPENTLTTALNDKDPLIQIHALRILLDEQQLAPKYHEIVLQALASSDANISRTAAAVLGHFPETTNLAPLTALYEKSNPEDSHLRYTTLVAIRNTLRDKKTMEQVGSQSWTASQIEILTKTLTDVPSAQGAAFVLTQLRNDQLPADKFPEYVGYASRYVSAPKLEEVIPIIRKKLNSDPGRQFAVYSTMLSGVAQSGGTTSAQMKEWGTELAKQSLTSIDEKTELWKVTPLDKAAETGAWIFSGDIASPTFKTNRMLIGQRATVSRVKSVAFEIPQSMQFNVFDNDILNSDLKTGESKNSVRVRLLSSGKIISEYRFKEKKEAGNDDVIKHVTFDLKSYKGQHGYMEITDSSRTASIGISQPESVLPAFSNSSPEDLVIQRLQAAQLAGKFKIAALQPELTNLLQARWIDFRVRAAAAEALMEIAPKQNSDNVLKIFSDRTETGAFRQKLAVSLGQAPTSVVYEQLEKELSGGARPLQVVIASVLSNSEKGIDHLISALKQEQIGPDILSETSVAEKLAVKASAEQQKQLSGISENGAGERAERLALIQTRLDGLSIAKALPAAGKEVFLANCSMCHQIRGNGGLVGPQLDGIGNWGQKALTEKILDPNRSISEAFRTYNIVLKNGQTLTGLYRRTEGEVMVFANLDGKEFSVGKSDMKDYKASRYTLMPDQFRHTIPEKDFYALVTYLLSVK
jgi:putative heme-binding domain-containing protein